jgi:hypothetical protein
MDNFQPVDSVIKQALTKSLLELEGLPGADILTMFGPIIDGSEQIVLKLVEDLASVPDKKQKIFIVLTTPGGMYNLFGVGLVRAGCGACRRLPAFEGGEYRGFPIRRDRNFSGDPVPFDLPGFPDPARGGPVSRPECQGPAGQRGGCFP